MTGNHCTPDKVKENIREVFGRVSTAAKAVGRSAADIHVMAVTKTVPPELVNTAVEEGISLLGENRVQEYLSKKDSYLPRAEVQFIGHLQSNKVKYIADSVSMIQSVSSVKLASQISREMGKRQRCMDILLEVNIGAEVSKSGFREEELPENLEIIGKMPNIRVKGLMCIPPISNSEKYFCRMNKLFVDIGTKKLDNIHMSILSMGMSGDFESAIRCGSNMIRLGTVLFGERSYL